MQVFRSLGPPILFAPIRWILLKESRLDYKRDMIIIKRYIWDSYKFLNLELKWNWMLIFLEIFVHTLRVKAKNLILFFPEMRVTKKISTRAAAKKFFFNFSKQRLHLKSYSNSIFLCWKAKSPVVYCLKGKNVHFCE